RPSALLRSFPTRRSSDLMRSGLSALRSKSGVRRVSALSRAVRRCTLGALCALLTASGGAWAHSEAEVGYTREQVFSAALRYLRRSEEHTSELQSHLNLVC